VGACFSLFHPSASSPVCQQWCELTGELILMVHKVNQRIIPRFLVIYMVIVGYDATPEAKKAIADGRIYGDAIQYPVKIGTLAIQTISNHFAGKKVPEVVPVPVGTWTKDSQYDLFQKTNLERSFCKC
jgi:hypothetical protein